MTATVRTREQILEDFADFISDVPAEHVEKIIESTMQGDRAYAAAGDPPACPAWCEYEPGHDYDSHVETTALRFHVNNEHERIGLLQEETNTAGVVSMKPLRIVLSGDDSSEHIDASAARQIAAELLNIADRYDEITAAQR